MSAMLALQGLLPLIVFAVVDIFAGMRAALIAAMLFAVGEAVWSYYSFGEVDQLTWASLALILVMGAVSFYMRNDKLFKFQPVALAALSAGALAYFQLKGEPLMVQMMPKVAQMFPEDQRHQFGNPQMIEIIARMDLLMIFVFLCHGLLVAWAAMKKTTLVWLVVRGVGFYVLMGLAVLANMLLVARSAG